MAKWADAVAKCDDGPGTRRPDARQGVKLFDSCPVERLRPVIVYRRSIGRPAGEREVGSQAIEGGLSDSRHPIETSDAAERPPILAIRHDPPGQRRTDPWQPFQLAHLGPVDIDALSRAEGAAQLQRAVAVGKGIAITRTVEEYHRRPADRRAAVASTDQVAAHRQDQDQDEGAAFVW